ncbi:MAG: hypothetical protein UW70_C0001G0011 [Candidatus Peregrinibacteria bacterium GW2011_GWA2_44_7]|nr:MAG: hypothetical protein UW70_C0001G0011 [Candidatus Peregrinibacteria bacterium GW2011_GWA2_44_7]
MREFLIDFYLFFMLPFQRFFLAFFLFSFGLFTVSASAQAFFTQKGETVFLNEYKTEDVYLAGEEVNVQADVEGDLFVAGDKITINGNINGDLFVAGNDVTINGSVQDDLRLASGALLLNGTVGGDTILASGTLTIGKDAALNGDLVLAAQTADFYGTLNQSLKAAVGTLHLGGKINGNAQVRAGESVTLLRDSQISGDFSYRSPQKVSNQGGTIEGETTYKQILPDAEVWKKNIASFLTTWGWSFKFFNLISLLAIGGIFIMVMPHFFQKTTDQINKAPLNSLGIGFMVLLVGTMIFFFSLIMLATFQISAVILSLLFLLIEGARIASAYWVGSWFFHKILKKTMDKKKQGRQSFFMLTVGLVVLFALCFVPFVGPLFQWVAFFMALGGIFVVKRSLHAQMVKERMI